MVVLLIGLLLIAMTGGALARPGKDGADRKPAQISYNGPEGYYIWQDKRGVHIWATAYSKKHVFSGVIRTDGYLSHVRGHRLEGRDAVDVYSDSKEGFWQGDSGSEDDHSYGFDGHEIDLEHDNLHFKFHTDGGTDGLSFKIKDASFVDFDLSVDGRQVSHRKFMLGAEGSILPTIIAVNSSN